MTPAIEEAADGAGDGQASGARAPDFFIIGHEKCGTTALYRILAQHPKIFMPALKEPRFFVAERGGAASPAPAEGSKAFVRPQTLPDYLALFVPAEPGQLTGEASPQYIRSPDAARLIAEVQPEARIIALLREPVSFLNTFHLNNVRELVEDERDLGKAMALEDERRAGRSLPPNSRAPNRLMYGDLVRYVEQLRRFEDRFGRDRMLVLVYEDFRRDNEAVVGEVLRFLGIDETFDFAPSETKRLRKGVRLPRLHRFALALQVARRRPADAKPWSRWLARLIPSRLTGGAIEEMARRAVFTVPEGPDERLALELRRRFKPEVAALGEYLGRDLVAEWGYDHLD